MKKLLFCLAILSFCNFSSFSQFSCVGLSTTNVTYTGGARTFTVPTGVTQVRISIKGGDGGAATATANNSGGGATVYAYFSVVAGDVFLVILGQKGFDGDNESGGGGASAVYKNGALVLVAGAGGGEDNTGAGGNGVTANNGTDGLPIHAVTTCNTDHIDNARGGIGGNGGKAGEECPINTHGGGGGGGFASAGNGKAGNYGGGGQGSMSGVSGGITGIGGAAGGWGWASGGGADDRESGGGGGYSGGGGGGEGGSPGGGGSFIASGFGITTSGSSIGVGTTAPVNGSGTICSVVPIILPIYLLDFSAEKINDAILLQWKTTNEINAAYFVIERSDNNSSFYVIGNINATGNSQLPVSYTFTDKTAISDKAVFRIKMVDKDGSYSYSPARLVRLKSINNIDIYPNPAIDRISVILPNNWKTTNNVIQIINADGQVVLQKRIIGLQSDLIIQQLPSGIYFVKVINEQFSEVLSKKFQK